MALAAVVVVGLAGPAQAALGTWTGSAGATWDSTATNWSGVTGTPWDSGHGPANAALFTGSPTPSVGDTVFAGGFYVGSGSGASTTLVISNGTLNLGGGSDWVAIGGKRAGGAGGIGTIASNCTLTITGGTINFLTNGASTVFFNPHGGTASTLNLNGGTVSTVTGFTDGAGSESNFNFNGGTLKFAAASTLPFNGKLNLNVQAGGAILDTGGNDVTIGGVAQGGSRAFPLKHSGSGTDGGLTKLGGGTLTLVSANTYNGPTTINAGTLTLSSAASLNAGSSVNIAAGATFDVSAYSTYTWGASAGLTASGTATAAILKGGATGVNLGSRPATLNFTPTTFTGDSSRPALNVSAGTLNLGTSTITVNNNAATPLAAGDYTLSTGTLSGTPTLNPVIGGAGLEAGASASLQFSVGNLILRVVGELTPTTTTVALQSPWTSSSTYGDALQFDVIVTGDSPTGTVTVKDGGSGGTTIGTGSLSGGSATVTLNPLNALQTGTYFNIVALYSGDGSNTSSVSTPLATQTVTKKTLTIPDAAAQNKPYDGNATATLTGTLSGVVSGDTVTLTLSGNFADAAPGIGKTVTSTSTIDALSQANYTLTQPASLTADIVAYTWTNLAGGDWGTDTNWQDSLIGDGVGTGSAFSTLDLTADTTVHLDSPRTARTLIFGDTDTGTAAAWLLDNNGTPANTLTLAGTTPTITVNPLGSGKSVTIGATIAGTDGLIKNGAGNLILSAADTYTGATTVSAGTLDVATGGAINNAGPISAVSGGTLQIEGSVTSTGHYYIGAGAAGSGTNIVNTGGTLNVGGSGMWVNIGGKMANGTGSIGNGTLTINGGSVNIAAGTAWYFNPYAQSVGPSPSTLNLNGGILSTAVALVDGAVSGSNVNFNGGTYKFTSASVLPFNGALNLNVQGGGAIFDTGGNDVTIGDIAQGGERAFPLKHSGSGTDGGLTKLGGGTLTLVSANTYNGATTINTGTLTLSSTASLNAASSVSIAAGATFDVSAYSAYTWGSTAGLAASGTASAATIKGKSGGTVSLGSQPIVLTYDGTNPALSVSQGTLVLNGNAFTVNSASPLTNGTYALVQQASGSITSSGTFTVTGTAIPSGSIGTIHVTGGTVNLVVSSGSPYDTWANGTFSPPLTAKLSGDNQDGDSLNNLQEFAFGTQPTVSTGEMVYSGVTLTSPGAPKIVAAGGTYSMVFGRRADYLTAGLTYTVQFTAGLDTWVDNNDGTNPPVQVATDGTINAMSVAYPDLIETQSGTQKPTFSRVKVELAP